jgi:hypothetical protein
MRGALNDPKVPALLERVGLMKYWRATRTKPDVCGKSARRPSAG